MCRELGRVNCSACPVSLLRCTGVSQPSQKEWHTAPLQRSSPTAIRSGRVTRPGNPPEREPSQPCSNLSGACDGVNSRCFCRYGTSKQVPVDPAGTSPCWPRIGFPSATPLFSPTSANCFCIAFQPSRTKSCGAMDRTPCGRSSGARCSAQARNVSIGENDSPGTRTARDGKQ